MTLSMTIMLAGVLAILKIQKLSNESVTNMHMHTTLKKKIYIFLWFIVSDQMLP